MNVNEVIRNITEIQNPSWADTLDNDQLESIQKIFPLIWMKLKKIKEVEIIEPLVRISKFLSEKKLMDGMLKVSFKNMDFHHFYQICIAEIPKNKYSNINPKKKKSDTPEDYQFVKLLAEDLKESRHNCEDYYYIYEELGILEKERKRLYSKYGRDYQPILNNKIEVVKINSINPNTTYPSIWQYDDFRLLKDIKSYGMLEPLLVDKKTNNIINGKRRYRCCRELEMKKVQVIKRKISSDLSYNKKPSTRTPTDMLEEYTYLRNVIMKLGYKERKKIMGELNMREYIYKETGVSQSQFHKLEYIRDNDPNRFRDIENGEKTIREVYLEIKAIRK